MQPAAPEARDKRAPGGETIRRLVGGSVIAALVAGTIYAIVAGRRLDTTHPETKLGAAPFVGRWEWRVGPRLLPAVALAAVAVWWLPRLAERARTRWCVLSAAVTGTLFALLLAAADGWHAVIAPVIDPTEYWAGVRTAWPFTRYLDTFAQRGLYSSVHVRGHPPGMMLLLIVMRGVGLRSPWAAAALSLIGVALTVGAVCCTLWRIGGADVAKRAAPLLAIVPYVIWQGTSADAWFCGVTASAVALASIAATTTGGRQFTAAAAAGVLGASAAFLTYGLVTMLPVFAALAVATRSWRWIPPMAAGAATVVGLFLWGGFWWLEGLRSTQVHYWAGTAKFRPAVYFAVANLVVLAMAVGLPVVLAITRVRLNAVGIVVLAALAGVLVAEASQYSKGETERIWLIFMPWLVTAGVFVATSTRRIRIWMACQGVAAVLLQAALVSKW